MTKTIAWLCVGTFALSMNAFAQEPVQAEPRHQLLLASSNPVLAANKRLVYDFWREVFEGGQLQLADRYLAESYTQHNPNVPTGRAGFVRFFAQFSKPKTVKDSIVAPLVSITAEKDIVVLAFVKEVTDPADPTQKYTTTWFDMFRIADGKIVEHWDAATKQ